MQYIDRKEITHHWCQKIFEKEAHHDHKLVITDNQRYAWEANPEVKKATLPIDFNDIIALFNAMGYDRNSEVMRKLYRDCGCSLYLYWEVFYDEINNENADQYRANVQNLEE